jgi:hypothetical protein
MSAVVEAFQRRRESVVPELRLVTAAPLPQTLGTLVGVAAVVRTHRCWGSAFPFNVAEDVFVTCAHCVTSFSEVEIGRLVDSTFVWRTGRVLFAGPMRTGLMSRLCHWWKAPTLSHTHPCWADCAAVFQAETSLLVLDSGACSLGCQRFEALWCRVASYPKWCVMPRAPCCANLPRSCGQETAEAQLCESLVVRTVSLGCLPGASGTWCVL